MKNLIEAAKSVLILLPEAPSFDEVACGASLFLALTQSEKEVDIYAPSPMIVEYNRLVGVNKVKQEIGNKNLVLSFDKSYNVDGIEKVSYDIDNGQFKLIIAPKANVAPPASNQVIVSYAGISADLVIMVGGVDAKSFPALTLPDLVDAKLAHVGILAINISGKTISSFDGAASSISEVTANLLKSEGYKIDSDVATDLLMGIEEATKGFSENASADTFAMISELMKAGGKRLNQGQVKANDFPAGAIPAAIGQNQVPSSWTEPKIFKGASVS